MKLYRDLVLNRGIGTFTCKSLCIIVWMVHFQTYLHVVLQLTKRIFMKCLIWTISSHESLLRPLLVRKMQNAFLSSADGAGAQGTWQLRRVGLGYRIVKIYRLRNKRCQKESKQYSFDKKDNLTGLTPLWISQGLIGLSEEKQHLLGSSIGYNTVYFQIFAKSNITIAYSDEEYITYNCVLLWALNKLNARVWCCIYCVLFGRLQSAHYELHTYIKYCFIDLKCNGKNKKNQSID